MLLIPVAARSKAWVCYRSLAGIAGSNPAGGMDVCLLGVLPVLQVGAFATGRSLIQESHTDCGLCVCVCVCLCFILSVIRCNSDLLYLKGVGRMKSE